jgi:hypothetical protein
MQMTECDRCHKTYLDSLRVLGFDTRARGPKKSAGPGEGLDKALRNPRPTEPAEGTNRALGWMSNSQQTTT